MEATDGALRVTEPIDVAATFTCGQIYHYWRDGDRFVTTVDDEPLTVEPRTEGAVVATGLGRDRVREFLGLDDDLDAILDAVAVDPPTRRAVAHHRGLRLLNIDPWPCLIGFVASQRSTVERTTAMVRRLCERYGEQHGSVVHNIPAPGTLAGLAPDDLRALGFGYRAEYVVETAEMVAGGEVDLAGLGSAPRDDVTAALTRLPGVGDKVADCVAMCGYGCRDVVALDARIRAVIDEHYPELDRDGYRETAEAFRDRFSPHTSYAQTYLYHDHVDR